MQDGHSLVSLLKIELKKNCTSYSNQMINDQDRMISAHVIKMKRKKNFP